MSDCWRKANPGLSWGKPCPQCGTYVRVYGDGAAEKQNLSGWLRNCPVPREQLNSIRACFGKPPLNKAAPPAFEPVAAKTAGAAAGCRIPRAHCLGAETSKRADAVALKRPESGRPLPNNDCGGTTRGRRGSPEAVTPRAWAVSDTDDFGPLSALPLVIPASLILWAVIAAAWIALK